MLTLSDSVLEATVREIEAGMQHAAEHGLNPDLINDLNHACQVTSAQAYTGSPVMRERVRSVVTQCRGVLATNQHVVVHL